MNFYVKGYTICVTITVLITMISVLMSTELHIRSVIVAPTKAVTADENRVVTIDPQYQLKTYDFRRNELKSEAENRRVHLFKDYLSEPIRGIPTVQSTDKHSNINMVNTGKGFDILFLRNVCYDSESKRIVLFTNRQSNTKFSSIIRKIPRQNAFASVEGEVPQIESLSHGNYFFFADNSMDEISQFSSVNFLIHFILHATDYPSIQRAFLPFLSISDLEESGKTSGISDIYEYLSIIQSFYPSQRPVELYYKEDLPDGLLCFKELIIPTMIQYADEGSIHLDLYEADTVRIAAYRYYQMFSKMPVPTTAIVLHALTKDEVEGRSGRISNMDEIDQFFKKKVAIWSYRSVVIDKVSKATKLHELFETDILFGIASHVFVNMIYLLPGSCVVAVSPCLLSSSHLNSIAEQSQLLFLEVSNFSIPIPPACNDRMSDVVGHIYSEKCLKELNQQEVYVQPGMLMSYLRVAKTYTMIHKYYDESEGDYVNV